MEEEEKATCHFCLWEQAREAHKNDSSFFIDTELVTALESQDNYPSFGLEEPPVTNR